MSNKVQDIVIKYCFFNDNINTKNFDPKILNQMKIRKKYCYLIFWIRDDQRSEIRKNL